MDVLWPNSLNSLTMYSIDPEAQGLINGAHGGTYHLLSDTGTEYQDSGLGYASVSEVEVKEHPIDGEEAPPQESRRKISSRDPMRQSVTLHPE